LDYKKINMESIILNGDCIIEMGKYPDNYFDSVVTDPPYGLGKEPDANEVLKDWIEKGYHEIQGKGFMDKEWDAFVPQPNLWKEVFRVLKPGGHVLAFYGTRTYDWGVMAMRFAGFEVRDCIQWLYGSGFPKSHNISKAIDKLHGSEREVVGSKITGTMNNKGGASVNKQGWDSGQKQIDITAPATKEAKKWDGWGSALKPANEPIVLARKPLEKGLSIAENVLKWGTGGINIDGCRVFTNEKLNYGNGIKSNVGFKTSPQNNQRPTYNGEGRFPANIILDKIAAEILDEQSGESKSSKSAKLYINNTEGRSVKNGASGFRDPNSTYSDSGGASRFFYVAKASKSERNKGLEDKNFHPTVKPVKLMQYLVRLITPQNGKVLDPFCGSGTTGVACKLEKFNFVGIEQDPEYTKIAQSRIKNTLIENTLW
jgi:site-specific DNA-methyltransferase (adenine-specific)